jgi:hypothetical protein
MHTVTVVLKDEFSMLHSARNKGLNPGRDKKFFSFVQRPDQLWGPHGLMSN